MNTKKSSHEGIDILVILEGIWKLTKIFCEIGGKGLGNIPWRRLEFYTFFIPLLYFAFCFGRNYTYLKFLHWVCPALFSPKVVLFLGKAPMWFHVGGSLCFWLGLLIFLYGIGDFWERRKYQWNLDSVGLKNAKGQIPTVVKITTKDQYRKSLLIRSHGIGVDRFENREKDLVSAFGHIVESIQPAQDRRYTVIDLTTMSLPRHCVYEELQEHNQKPYTFVVGESLRGVELCNIADLPHLMLAGVTRSGKSNFLKQMLLSLLDKPEPIQMFLIDLKGGVEMKEFSELPNVEVTKDSGTAVACLSQVNEELQKRFKYLEEKGRKSIDPETDEMDRLIVAVDEASDLYARGGLGKAEKEIIQEAQKYTDQIAKKGGAAAIHLILCTQKFVKEVIPTVIADNLTGKLCFRVTSRPASQNVLGVDDAFNLPKVAGRAVWRVGNELTELQTPSISNDIIREKISILKQAWKSKEKKNFKPVIDLKKGREVNSYVEESILRRI